MADHADQCLDLLGAKREGIFVGGLKGKGAEWAIVASGVGASLANRTAWLIVNCPVGPNPAQAALVDFFKRM